LAERERALPDLGANIRCGNSLVGLDFYNSGQMGFLDGDQQLRVNPFDWGRGFSDAMIGGGFDVVLGNPPYIFGEYHNAHVKSYLLNHYDLASGQYDTYKLFVEKGWS
jgi:hypothetical protein